MFEIQKIIKSNLNHQENIISNIWAVIELISSSLSRKSDFWSSILESFFSLENLSKIYFIFLTKRLFFHLNLIVWVSNLKIVQYFIWKSFNFTSTFNIAIIRIARKRDKKLIYFRINRSFSSRFWVNSISILRNLISKIITSEIFDRISFFRFNSNHLSFSKTFQNSIYSSNKTIFLFCFDDNFDIESKNHSNLYQHLVLQSFILFKKQFENLFVDFSKIIALFNSCDEFNINSSKI